MSDFFVDIMDAYGYPSRADPLRVQLGVKSARLRSGRLSQTLTVCFQVWEGRLLAVGSGCQSVRKSFKCWSDRPVDDRL